MNHFKHLAPGGRRCWVRMVWLALWLPWLLACGGSSDPAPEMSRRPSQTIDVKPVIEDIEFTGDQQAVARKPTLTGALPSDFPADIPLFLPASLIDFGGTADGWRSVSLATPAGQSKVDAQLMGLLDAAGWRVTGSEGGARRLSKGELTVRLRIEGASTGAVYHFEY